MAEERGNTAVIRAACAVADTLLGPPDPALEPADLRRLRASVLLNVLAALVLLAYGLRNLAAGYSTLLPLHAVTVGLLIANLVLIRLHRNGTLAALLLGCIMLWETTALVSETGKLMLVLPWWGAMPCAIGILSRRPWLVALWAAVCTCTFVAQVYLSDDRAGLRNPYLTTVLVTFCYGLVAVLFSAVRARQRRDLEEAETRLEDLSKLVPICSYCKQVRSDDGYWRDGEHYLREHAGADLTHGICPDCYEKELARLRSAGQLRPDEPTRVDTPAARG